MSEPAFPFPWTVTEFKVGDADDDFTLHVRSTDIHARTPIAEFYGPREKAYRLAFQFIATAAMLAKREASDV